MIASIKKRGRPSKKGGGKLGRTEVLQVRLAQRLRFTTELAARYQNRTVSSFIELALESYIQGFSIHQDGNRFQALEQDANQQITILKFVDNIWDNDEVVRFTKLAQTAPGLLSAEEVLIWSVINKHDFFWIYSAETDQRVPFFELIRAMWEELQLLSVESDFDGSYIAMATDKMLLLNTSASPEKIAALRKAMNDLWPSHDDD